jgi:hypothetical protein
VAVAVERLLKAGFQVAIPLVDEGYDLLAFSDRMFWRIQVKATAGRGSKDCRRRIRIGRGADGRQLYSPDQIDAFIAVNVSTSAVMCVPLSQCAGRRFLNWSQASRWSDVAVLRSIRPAR